MQKSVGVAKNMSTTHSRMMTAAASRFKYGQYNNRNSNQGRKNRMYPLAALGLLGLVGGYEMLKKKLQSVAECCGIIGYIGAENIAGKLVLDGIQILQYRGYDS